MIEACRDFTRNGIGRQVLSMSMAEVLRATNGYHMHPLRLADYGLVQLHDSPLRYDRREPNNAKKYQAIFSACGELFRDTENARP